MLTEITISVFHISECLAIMSCVCFSYRESLEIQNHIDL